jgi:hypothetical protein
MATQASPLVEAVQAAQPVAQAAQGRSTLDYIVENQAARMAAEQAISDGIVAKKYASGAQMTEDQATYIIALGRDFGLNGAQSLQALDLIGGRPAMRAAYKALFLRQAGYSWKVLKHDDTISKYRFYYKGEAITDAEDKPLDFAFTIEEANKAGYVENARGKEEKDGKRKPGNYDKIPKNMLFARMISNFQRWHAPDVIGASVPELGELVDAVVQETEIRMAASTLVTSLSEKLAAAKGEEVAA